MWQGLLIAAAVIFVVTTMVRTSHKHPEIPWWRIWLRGEGILPKIDED